MAKHYASGDVNNQGMDPAALAAGFNMADVGDADTLKSLPSNVQGLYYLDEAKGVTSSFVSQMDAIKGAHNLFGVYLADEPDPSKVSAASLKAESDWIHANMPGVKTFIVADNQGSNTNPDFHNYYTQASTHIDLWGLDVYPFRTEIPGGGDVTEVDRTVAAAKSQIGITTDQIVPVFQAFGGGNFPDGDGGKWSMPTPSQEKALMAEWQKFAPNPAFDYAYSWQQQEGDNHLSADAALTDVFKGHNGGASVSSPTSPNPPPLTSPSNPTNGAGGDTSTNSDHHHQTHQAGGGHHAHQTPAASTGTSASPAGAHADSFAFQDLKGLNNASSTDHAGAAAATRSNTLGHHGVDMVGSSSSHETVSVTSHDGHTDHASVVHETPLVFQDHHLV